MGDPKGFLKVKRQSAQYRPVCERIKDYGEVSVLPQPAHTVDQACRCMDCGTPFCHWGCPIGNYIPEWNDAVYRGRWDTAFDLLDATNNWPEITGRICPAPCEYACVLGINDDPVTIRENELAVIEYAFRKGWVSARKPGKRTKKKVCVVGSGPAGLSCAAQLNAAGHQVTVFEKSERIGGILRYGIPDFKLQKSILERRLTLLEKEGIVFVPGVHAGVDCRMSRLRKEFDAICLAGGSGVPRDLAIPGRELKGVYFAMEYLIQSNRRRSGEVILAGQLIDAHGKSVVVIGGGDTGSDCVGTAHRQGARCVMQIEIMPRLAECRTDKYPWPVYPLLCKTSSSHEEGGGREWAVETKKFSGLSGQLRKLHCVRVSDGAAFEIEADLVILALGFLHPAKEGPIDELGLALDARGNVRTDCRYMTSVKGVFSAGDMHRGQSLIVWAIAEGRRAAHHIDTYLMGHSFLPLL